MTGIYHNKHHDRSETMALDLSPELRAELSAYGKKTGKLGQANKLARLRAQGLADDPTLSKAEADARANARLSEGNTRAARIRWARVRAEAKNR